MRLLLDTHALLWWLAGNERLSAAARAAIAAGDNSAYVSAATAWEISTKHRIGKLPGAASLVGRFAEILKKYNLFELPITLANGERAGALAGVHRDPFDRMLVAQALMEPMILVSGDARLDAFGVDRLW